MKGSDDHVNVHSNQTAIGREAVLGRDERTKEAEAGAQFLSGTGSRITNNHQEGGYKSGKD